MGLSTTYPTVQGAADTCVSERAHTHAHTHSEIISMQANHGKGTPHVHTSTHSCPRSLTPRHGAHLAKRDASHQALPQSQPARRTCSFRTYTGCYRPNIR